MKHETFHFILLQFRAIVNVAMSSKSVEKVENNVVTVVVCGSAGVLSIEMKRRKQSRKHELLPSRKS